MYIDPYSRTLSLDVVYCGPAEAGKSATLEHLNALTPPTRRGAVTRVSGPHGGLFAVASTPRALGEPEGLRLRVRSVRLPGGIAAGRAADSLLRRADAVVFVADSSAGRQAQNEAALSALAERLDALGMGDLPVVFQWHKRDARDAAPVEDLERRFNPAGCASFATSTQLGRGDRHGIVEANDAAIRAAFSRSGLQEQADERCAAK